MIYNQKELIREIRFTGDNRNNAVIPLSGCLAFFTEKVLLFISGIALLCLVVWVILQKKFLYLGFFYLGFLYLGFLYLCLIIWVISILLFSLFCFLIYIKILLLNLRAIDIKVIKQYKK